MKKILLCLCLLLLVTGCGNAPKLENGQDAVVTLSKANSISVDNLYAEMKDSYAIGVLLDMMDTNILNDKYPTSDEETDQVEGQINTWLSAFGSEEVLLQQVQSAFGVTSMDELRSYLSLQYKRGKAVEDYTKGLVSDDEVKKYYDEEVFGDIHARHILIEADITSDMSEEEKATKEEEALQQAKDVITRLNNGEAFDAIAKELSDDEDTKDDGGDLGFFVKGEMTKEFEEAAKKLAVGEYTKEPVKTTYGYHIILKVEEREKAPFEQWQEKIKETLASDKLTDDPTLQITALMELRKEYGMYIEDETLRNQYDALMTQQKESLTTSSGY